MVVPLLAHLASLGVQLPEEQVPATPGPAPDTGKALVDYLIDKLLSRLQEQQLPVRLPSYGASTFRAIPIGWDGAEDLPGPGAGGTQQSTYQVFWNPIADASFPGTPQSNSTLSATNPAVPEPFPKGWIGIVRARCAVASGSSQDLENALRAARWSLLVNGGPVSGMLRRIPEGDCSRILTVTTPFNQNSTGGFPSMMGAPVILRAGDTMQVRFHLDDQAATTRFQFYARVEGYRFPETDSNRDLAGFLQD